MHPAIIGLGVMLFAIILYSALNGYFSGVTRFRYSSQTATILAEDINNANADVFSYAMSLKVNKLDRRQVYTIFDRESEITMFIQSGKLCVATHVTDCSNGLFKRELSQPVVLMKHFPLQKWVHLVASVRKSGDPNNPITTGNCDSTALNSILDFYLDGKLLKSIALHYTKIVSPDEYPLVVGSFDSETGYVTTTPDAQLVGLQRWDYAATIQLVMDEYNNAQMKNLLGDYNIDIATYHGKTLASRFSVF
jgi:hypothetical protein